VTASISPLASQFELLGIKSQAQLDAVRDNAKEARRNTPSPLPRARCVAA